jgi:hypothetical protein
MQFIDVPKVSAIWLLSFKMFQDVKYSSFDNKIIVWFMLHDIIQ